MRSTPEGWEKAKDNPEPSGWTIGAGITVLCVLVIAGGLFLWELPNRVSFGNKQDAKATLEAYREVADEACHKACQAEGGVSLPTYLQSVEVGDKQRREVVCWCLDGDRKWEPKVYPLETLLRRQKRGRFRH
jgi:hypothetical protein